MFSIITTVQDAKSQVVESQVVESQVVEKLQLLEETLVTANQRGTTLSRTSPLKTETITHAGLTKLACCSLSESFENSASVSVGFTDAVSGARQIKLLGLSGIYTQMLAENIPTLRGLAATYGWNYIPSSWLESIQISKGASSVVNGYESIAGQMNLEFKKPHNNEPLYLDFYTNNERHYEGNLASAVQLNKNVWTELMLHGTIANTAHDRNNDHFLDMPKMQYINAYNRWFYLNQERGVQSRTGIKFLYETRKAGQDSTCHESNGLPLLETLINNRNMTAYNKTGIAVGSKEGQSIGIINSFTHHEQNSDFGRKHFDGTQTSYYANILFTSFIHTPDHRYTAGVSFVYDNYDTEYSDSAEYNHTPLTKLQRTESVPGAFAEYTYSGIKGLTVVLGGRTDYNSLFGWLITPRANIKYDMGEYVILRASAGRGFRSPNVIADNIGLMASSRNFDVTAINGLDMEQAWNYGGSVAAYIPLWGEQRATLSLDYFRTVFQNQAIIDTERNRQAVYFYNLNGNSYADAWQADLSMTFLKGFDLFAAFRYNNNRITYAQESSRYEVDQPLVSKYRGLLNLSYATTFKRWVFDFTAQINGPARLPGLNGYSSEPIHSPAYPLLFAQITKNSKRFDVYIGAENLLGYTQKDPILGWKDPFARDFDASMVWGPITGAKVYGGIRLRIGDLK
ncbi:MAG: TonB-dependent receptor [Mediterranea sp.]|jgi:outer membrane receptor for ferrienterochelin and colicin|nr:TonB-dependent receptor [Mediterranea sp.]